MKEWILYMQTRSSNRRTRSRILKPGANSRQADLPLRGRVALVTGGSRGIGLAIANGLAIRGATVVITGRDERALAAAVARLNKNGNIAVARYCDVCNSESVAGLFLALKKQFKRLDILLNNAGIAGPASPIEKLSLDEWREIIDTNLTGLFLVTKAALPLLKRGATIVNNLSISAKTAFPGMAAYNASKHGALGFTDTLREELKPKEIRVVSLMPGATDTEIWEQFWPDAPRERMISRESIAEAVAMAVCLPENTSVTEIVIAPTAGAL